MIEETDSGSFSERLSDLVALKLGVVEVIRQDVYLFHIMVFGLNQSRRVLESLSSASFSTTLHILNHAMDRVSMRTVTRL
ncbi:hypothetical protein RRG08_057842 [Elysia crispata]|uniref:Uncharacterized protein n=1 Tax=Elysia crispata TaxID=231223 RepID=A0AAE1AZN8_9GAST|nr:hypothetical protein RRG08_057842 [Elysia crispata]